MGIALPDSDSKADDLIGHADQAMYQAKLVGKDPRATPRVCAAL